MADESLRELYYGIEADSGEVARYRGRLARKLPSRPAKAAPTAKPAPTATPAWMALVMTAAALLLAVISLTPRGLHVPSQRGQANLRAETPERLNATMFLCLTGTPEQGIKLAARGLQDDPRPAFRAYYLEYLLEYADEHRFNAALVEALMDRETDRLCFDLLEEMYDLST